MTDDPADRTLRDRDEEENRTGIRVEHRPRLVHRFEWMSVPVERWDDDTYAPKPKSRILLAGQFSSLNAAACSATALADSQGGLS